MLLHTVEVTGSNPVSPSDLYEDAINSPPYWTGGAGGLINIIEYEAASTTKRLLSVPS